MVAGQNPVRGLAGNEGKVGDGHGETEHYLPVVLVRPERVGWGLAEGAVAHRQWQAAAAALRRAGDGMARPESTSGRRGFRSGGRLGLLWRGRGRSAWRSWRRRQWWRGGSLGASAGMRNIWI